jgi:ElaA protein
VIVPPGPEPNVAHATDVTPEVLYRILQLRVDVFVVEQGAAYRELDGLDLDAATRLLWVQDPSGDVLATLRVLPDPAGARIGRVATARSARSGGHAGRLIGRALELTDAARQDVVLGAQAYLREWYERFGFRVSGPAYDEDGIAHLPMIRRYGG